MPPEQRTSDTEGVFSDERIMTTKRTMLHELSTKKKKKKKIGRGGARGAKSGRGNKGQRSRAGRRIRPALRDELARIPKRRGYNKNRARGVRNKDAVRSVTLETLEKHFQEKSIITPKVLTDRGVVTKIKGRVPSVKVVARGNIATPITIRKCAVSAGAKQKIEAAGGTIQ